MNTKVRIKKADAIKLADKTEKEFDAKRQQVKGTDQPIAWFGDQDAGIYFEPNGNAGYYVLQGDDAAVNQLLVVRNIVPLPMKEPASATALEPIAV